MNIFLWELRANVKSLLVYSIIVILLTVTGFAKFSAYADNPDLLAILDSMPQALLDALNVRAFNLTTVSGFYGVMYVYYTLIAALAAALWGSDIIAKEERDKTVEFSLVLPVTRNRLVTAKILAVLAYCLALLAVIWGIVRFSVRSYHPDAEFLAFLRLSMFGLFLLQLVFLAVGVLLGCTMQYRRAGMAAVAVLMTAYFVSLISGLHEKLEFLKYLTPFQYVDAALLWRESRIEPLYLALMLGIVAVSLAAAYLAYNRRDLYI